MPEGAGHCKPEDGFSGAFPLHPSPKSGHTGSTRAQPLRSNPPQGFGALNLPMTDQPKYRPTAIRAPHGAREFGITWADGHVTRLPHELLRGYCPCAGCQGHSGAITFQAGRDLELRDIQRVGNYALALTWGDGHSAGIYTFTYLRALGDLIEAEGAEAVRDRGTLPRLG